MSVPPDQNPMASTMQTAAQPQTAAPPNPVAQAQAASDSVPTPQDQAQGSSNDPRPVGYKSQTDEGKQQATPEEQAQYTQLINRFMLYISDTRKSHHQLMSPAAATLHALNNPHWNVPQALGNVAADTIFMLYMSAKQQKAHYSESALFHGADECIGLLYILGQAHHIFKGTPPFKGYDEKKPYPFTPQEIAILAHAKLTAVQRFGQRMQSAGQYTDQDRQQAMTFWRQQIQKEIQQGKVSDETVNKLMQSPQMQQAMQSNGSNAQSPQPQAPQQAAPSTAPQQPAPQPQGATP